MSIDLSQESERLASEARKLACLGAELNRADVQIDLGECSEFDEHTLKNLFEDVEAEGMRRLAPERARVSASE